MSKISDSIRKSFKENDTVRDSGLETPETIMRFDDIAYGKDRRFQMLDIYRPKDREGEPLPVIVSVHGGGWIYGDKETYQYYCMDLAQRGFAVVNFSYRLAPEYQFPAALEDTAAVFCWIEKNAEAYGLDTGNLFAVGDSAGAHILGLFTVMCTNPEYAENYSFAVPKNMRLSAIALNCGEYVTSTDEKENYLMKLFIKEMLPEKGSERELKLLNVPEQITEDYVPCFVMTCIDDFLKDSAPLVVQKLTECGIPFVYRMYGDKQNRLTHVFHCNIRLPEARRCNDEECAFFRSYIK